MTAPACIHSDAVAPQPWRNGGGRTRELLAWPPGVPWRLRVSVADIDADGPFSAFPGVTRWFAVLDGAGVALTLGPAEHRLTPASAPVAFDGAAAPGCRLLDGPTRDLNLMLRGVRGTLQRAAPGVAWAEPWPWRGVFSAGAARLRDGGGADLDLAAFTLVHGLAPGALQLWPEAEAPAFWLGAEVAS